MTTTYIALANTTLSSATSTVTFSSIPATYRDLIVVLSLRATSGIVEPRMRFNSDAGSNYSFVQMAGNGSGVLSNVGTTTGGWLAPNTPLSLTNFDTVVAQIMDYSATDKHKTYLSRLSPDANYLNALAVRWANTAAINSLNFYTTTGTFTAGSTFSLYGVN